MEGDEPYLPPESATSSSNSTFKRPVNPDCTTSTTSSSSSSPNAFLNNFIAAFKRHRPLGMNNIKPRRMFVPQQETPKSSTCVSKSTVFNGKRAEEDCISESNKNMDSVVAEHASMILPSTMNTYEESSNQFADCKNIEPQLERQKKVHFATRSDARFQEMDWDRSNQTDVPTVGHDLPHQSTVNEEVDKFMGAGGNTSLLVDMGISDQLHKFSNFIHNDASQPITQSSVVGLSCATTTLINAGSAPKLSSTTYCSEPQQETDSKLTVGRVGDVGINYQSTEKPAMIPLDPPSNCKKGVLHQQLATGGKVQSSTSKAGHRVETSALSNEKETYTSKDSYNAINPSSPIGGSAAIDIKKGSQSEAPLSHVSDAKLESNKLGKQVKSVVGKAVSMSRKKTYDADLFFKVNGKLYQRLGKIGSGGSSEVHKVISSDCTIYALKKIKLKGRDYATAFGFCQEIQYLNKLKGKHNIIQLVDFEVTDKALLQEVINGSMSNKDGRVKEDGYIYMVLEYGEIDLAHMLSQEWKGLDGSNITIDQNWLRYYWQQILQAVNTIHEERIVHSDLKPANFLLVRGSLKLIDFGIAKAIMSDTTNIQRDSQVGTLSYMSPEAFMCNEKDANGNTIKCGRPSDIWSLGCILYQMVYGRTPFSEYKTFWAKFKVITDPNHKIEYGRVSNPWLKDLMEKCLAWDRNERWRIPQLLQHPFLVPPIPPQVSMPIDQSSKLLNIVSQSCKGDPTTLTLCAQLERLLKDPKPSIHHSLGELQKLFLEMSNQCLELQKQMGKVEGQEISKVGSFAGILLKQLPSLTTGCMSTICLSNHLSELDFPEPTTSFVRLSKTCPNNVTSRMEARGMLLTVPKKKTKKFSVPNQDVEGCSSPLLNKEPFMTLDDFPDCAGICNPAYCGNVAGCSSDLLNDDEQGLTLDDYSALFFGNQENLENGQEAEEEMTMEEYSNLLFGKQEDSDLRIHQVSETKLHSDLKPFFVDSSYLVISVCS